MLEFYAESVKVGIFYKIHELLHLFHFYSLEFILNFEDLNFVNREGSKPFHIYLKKVKANDKIHKSFYWPKDGKLYLYACLSEILSHFYPDHNSFEMDIM